MIPAKFCRECRHLAGSLFHAGTSYRELARDFKTHQATIGFWSFEDGWDGERHRLARAALTYGPLREAFEAGASWVQLQQLAGHKSDALRETAKYLGWDLLARENALKGIVRGGHDAKTLGRMRTRRHKHAKRAARSDATSQGMASILKSSPICTYCSRPLTYEERSLDHIEPLRRGGMHSLDNLTVCCFACNSSKRDRPLLAWLASRRAA